MDLAGISLPFMAGVGLLSFMILILYDKGLLKCRRGPRIPESAQAEEDGVIYKD